MALNFCAGAYPLGKPAKALPTRGEEWPSVLRAYKTPTFAKGQKLTQSPAHEEKQAGQETPLLYTPYLQWHDPGGGALLQLAQAPTQDYHSYTHALLGVVGDQVVSPNDPPVKIPPSPSWTSARASPANQKISGTEVSTRPCPSLTVLTVFYTWTTRRCRSSGAMTSPSW